MKMMVCSRRSTMRLLAVTNAAVLSTRIAVTSAAVLRPGASSGTGVRDTNDVGQDPLNRIGSVAHDSIEFGETATGGHQEQVLGAPHQPVKRDHYLADQGFPPMLDEPQTERQEEDKMSGTGTEPEEEINAGEWWSSFAVEGGESEEDQGGESEEDGTAPGLDLEEFRRQEEAKLAIAARYGGPWYAELKRKHLGDHEDERAVLGTPPSFPSFLARQRPPLADEFIAGLAAAADDLEDDDGSRRAHDPVKSNQQQLLHEGRGAASYFDAARGHYLSSPPDAVPYLPYLSDDISAFWGNKIVVPTPQRAENPAQKAVAHLCGNTATPAEPLLEKLRNNDQERKASVSSDGQKSGSEGRDAQCTPSTVANDDDDVDDFYVGGGMSDDDITRNKFEEQEPDDWGGRPFRLDEQGTLRGGQADERGPLAWSYADDQWWSNFLGPRPGSTPVVLEESARLPVSSTESVVPGGGTSTSVALGSQSNERSAPDQTSAEAGVAADFEEADFEEEEAKVFFLDEDPELQLVKLKHFYSVDGPMIQDFSPPESEGSRSDRRLF